MEIYLSSIGLGLASMKELGISKNEEGEWGKSNGIEDEVVMIEKQKVQV